MEKLKAKKTKKPKTMLPENLLTDCYSDKVFKASTMSSRRVMVGVPTTGVVRMEWVLSRYGQVTPCNWSQVDCLQWMEQFSPLGFLVADARNVIVSRFIAEEFEWLFFIDHDTMMPPGTVLRFNDRMLKEDVPIWSGLYFCKGVPAEPLLYRGRGNSYYTKWKFGDEVWVDGIPMGCTVIHHSILKALWDESEEYEAMPGLVIRKVFETPSRTFYDPETKSWFNAVGTEDLEWCTRIMENNIFEKAGWKKYQKKKYPFLVDTAVFCKHIAPDGTQYPAYGEEQRFNK